ncbi:serine protease Do [Nitrosomonas cryotolerans]|uniref:Probable periplasmic serine endoprotease DegP-like n=1 Tax=Nitrosomonas cryotolerans ATCC 49181 TaxID=1131553 RepID=A0A1N6IM74_9PROT|nr:DegQ family serine endoprotease [Nitrosomonas cryotolerans]SFP36701.1 serine protease Do [Nitrosomonas cryotolerans]SIO33109.1 serine protease Do [Nitrosomonas cryotolerans ATCC 49181]
MHKFVLSLLLIVSPAVFSKTKDLPDFTGLVEKYGAAVVNISTIQTQHIASNSVFPELPNIPESSPFHEFFRRHIQPFSMPKKTEPRSMGSGFIISTDGYILTNAHVVESADEVNVKLNDKREFSAKIIGSDRKTDIALIKIEANNLPKVTQGNPELLKVGEWVVAIGSPFGFENSVTAGIVSAKGRSLAQENFVPFIQTDVAINPGNSGGPLFNMMGEVVGINSQIYSRTGGFMGLSFAIPINVAASIADQLKINGKVSRGRIGVMIQEVTKELAESFGLSNINGALVVSIQKDSPADKAGIEVRDIILKFDGKDVATSADLPRIVGNTKPGSEVSTQIWRDGSTKNIMIEVEEILSDERAGNNQPKQSKQPNTSNNLGLALSELTASQKKQLDINSGLLVEDIRPGTASRAGIHVGDIILGLNNQDISSIKQFNRLLNKVEKGRNIALLIRRGDMTTFITMKLDKINDKKSVHDE